ncbi:hypothetical protein [Streptomyces brasiliensis]|uniref:Uncharacterized protein n=1 Tax=Streptomyces brasiliensis TaxID=1954 RepID=A0A917P3S8_9ACTN|nr:hypothetical protein [Streptomyces brasiliensis]GGJ59083.1 hypothetical protein GCM10010121_082180 [Streptomyces brasiliensis]
MTVQRSFTRRTPSSHLLKIQLEGMEPPAWRRLGVPSGSGDERILCRRLLSDTSHGPCPSDQVAARADHLRRADHPHSCGMLGALADALKPVDKALAKPVRTAAFKAGSAK